MAFIHVKGPAKTEGFQKLASTLIAAGALVSFAISGRISQALVQSTRIAGISLKKVASTDDDYADTTVIPVIIPSEDDVFEVPVSGTAAQANVGFAYDLTAVAAGTSQAVNLSGITYKTVTVVKFINSSTVWVKINGNYAFANKTLL